jgi:hypothetical protein
MLGRFGGCLALLVTVACSVTLPVRTIPRGETRWTGSLTVPVAAHLVSDGVPYVTVGVLRGVRDGTTLLANAHVLAAAAAVAGVDAGVARRLVRGGSARPELTLQAGTALFVGASAARVFPAAALTASWAAGSRMLIYIGANATAQFTAAPHWLITPGLGLERQLSGHWIVQLEARWLAANVATRVGLFEGAASLDGRGASVVQLGVQWRR